MELAIPDAEGFSRKVLVAEFVERYAGLELGNGGSWCRDDGPLGRQFNIKRHKSKGKIVAVELQGNKKVDPAKPIPTHIQTEIKQQKCVVLGTSKVECDHRDGRLDDPRLADASRVTIEDFQPLSKAANNAKRQHCKTCRQTNKRFDAKRLGFPVSQIKGNGIYNGTCIGCYWHDPKRFHAEAYEQKATDS